MSPILVRSFRGGGLEGRRVGHIAVASPSGEIVYSLGDPDYETFFRSAAKPIQVFPLIEAGGMEHFGFEVRHLAMMVASHSGQPIHVEIVREILARIGLGEEDLLCGPHAPMHEGARDDLVGKGIPFGRIHNNCSGKHAGMLALARLKGWPIEDYIEADHPVQRAVTLALEEVTGTPCPMAIPAVDGCGIPTFRGALSALATSFARIATDSFDGRRADAASRVRMAMMSHPLLIAGDGRLDTLLMEEGGDVLFSKVGAKGVIGIGLPGRRLGIAIKLEDGFLDEIEVAARHALRLLGIDPWGGAGPTTQPVTNWVGRRVGRLESSFELDFTGAVESPAGAPAGRPVRRVSSRHPHVPGELTAG